MQLHLLEGQSYDAKVEEVGAANITARDYEVMALLDNMSNGHAEPLLVPGRDCPGEHTADNKLMVPFEKASALSGLISA